MNRGPIILTIEEAEYILDQFGLLASRPSQPPPSSDEDELTTKLRQRFKDLLVSLRANAEGTSSSAS